MKTSKVGNTIFCVFLGYIEVIMEDGGGGLNIEKCSVRYYNSGCSFTEYYEATAICLG